MPTYNILKTYNGPTQLEMIPQRNRLSQEFVIYFNGKGKESNKRVERKLIVLL